LAILRSWSVELPGKAETGQVRGGCGATRPGGSRKRACLSLKEHATGACCFLLRESALLCRVDRRSNRWRYDRLAAVLRIEDRSTEIARQRGAESRAGIVAWQIGETISGGAVARRVKFFVRRAAVSSLKGVDQRAAKARASDQADRHQCLARQAGDTRRLATQPHRSRDVARSSHCLAMVALIIGVAHDEGLPSLRTILTVCCRLPLPSRSSAAPKSRSTIRMFW